MSHNTCMTEMNKTIYILSAGFTETFQQFMKLSIIEDYNTYSIYFHLLSFVSKALDSTLFFHYV